MFRGQRACMGEVHVSARVAMVVVVLVRPVVVVVGGVDRRRLTVLFGAVPCVGGGGVSHCAGETKTAE